MMSRAPPFHHAYLIITPSCLGLSFASFTPHLLMNFGGNSENQVSEVFQVLSQTLITISVVE